MWIFVVKKKKFYHPNFCLLFWMKIHDVTEIPDFEAVYVAKTVFK